MFLLKKLFSSAEETSDLSKSALAICLSTKTLKDGLSCATRRTCVDLVKTIYIYIHMYVYIYLAGHPYIVTHHSVSFSPSLSAVSTCPAWCWNNGEFAVQKMDLEESCCRYCTGRNFTREAQVSPFLVFTTQLVDCTQFCPREASP